MSANGGGCQGCLDYVGFSNRVRSASSWLKDFLWEQITEHYIRSLLGIMCIAIIFVSWLTEFERELSPYITVYCSALLFCSGVTFTKRGCLGEYYNTCCNTCCPTGGRRTRSNQMTVQGRPQGSRSVQTAVQRPESGSESRPAAAAYTEEDLKGLPVWERKMVLKGRLDLSETEKGQKQDEPPRQALTDSTAEPPIQGHSLNVTADFHRAECDPSESSNSVEPSTSSDDPLPKPGPSALGKSLKQSSTDPSTRSTSIMFIDDDANEGHEGAPPSPSSDEFSPQPGPSGLCRTYSLSSSS